MNINKINNFKSNCYDTNDEQSKMFHEIVESFESPNAHEASKATLIIGASGSGKTRFLKALIINTSSVYAVFLDSIELMSKSEEEIIKCLTRITEELMSTHVPSILVIDNIDYIAPNMEAQHYQGTEYHHRHHDHHNHRIASVLISMIDRLNFLVVIFVSAKSIHTINPSLRSSGRLPRVEDFNHINNEMSRFQILKAYSSQMSLHQEVDNVFLRNIISKKTQGFVGADIAMLCRNATILSIEDKLQYGSMDTDYEEEVKVTTIHFQRALQGLHDNKCTTIRSMKK